MLHPSLSSAGCRFLLLCLPLVLQKGSTDWDEISVKAGACTCKLYVAPFARQPCLLCHDTLFSTHC